MPSAVDLLFGAAGQEPQRITLSRSLDDPVFGGILQDVRSDLLYHVEYADQRTRDYTISVYQCPELVRADAKIVYPAYTKLPEKTIKDTRQVSVVEGSEVTLMFTLNKPVATARLVPKTGIALGLAVDGQDPNVLTASLTASQSQQYELQHGGCPGPVEQAAAAIRDRRAEESAAGADAGVSGQRRGGLAAGRGRPGGGGLPTITA